MYFYWQRGLLNIYNQNSGAANHSDFGNVLFLDGHVKGYPTDAWLTNSGIDQHLEPNQVNPS